MYFITTGAFAIFLEPWHLDIFEFLDLKKNSGVEDQRARDLFYGLWVPNLFMQRVADDDIWTLFSPNEVPELPDCHNERFDEIYKHYEKTKQTKHKREIKARVLWEAILTAQMETGTPYMLYKDAVNYKSNQKNLGTIQSSNLCCEVCEYTSPEEIANCNLASLALPMFLKKDLTFDHEKLFEIVKIVVRGLNKVIDVNDYPVPQAKLSNLRHRPVGLGVQGLADLFIMMRLPFDSEEARALNKDIFETIHFASLTASNELAQEEGCYETMRKPHPITGEIAPIARGIFQFQLHYEYQLKMHKSYSDIPMPDKGAIYPSSGRWNWDGLSQKIVEQSGIRNSLLNAPMPTASTSQILGFNESFEPITSNIYVRRTLAGEFVCVSRHLVQDLIRLGIWNPLMKDKLIANNGSVQKIAEIPADLKAIYRTVWEISQKSIVEMAADRQAFIDQSQSMNIHMQNVNFGKLGAMHFYGWKRGLKTGMYYLRSKPAVDAVKFTIDPSLIKEQQEQDRVEKALRPDASMKNRNSRASDEVPIINLLNTEEIKRQREAMICSLNNPDECKVCGS